MKIYGIEKLSLVDFDGVVACTLFTGACNFLCPFCHNSPLVNDYSTIPTIDINEIFDYLKKRKGLLEGVCISGGEPTLQPDLVDFALSIKDLGYKVKIDTNGTNPNMIRELIEKNAVDYFAMDIKNSISSYGKTVGIKNYDTKRIEESVKILMSSKIPYEFRTTIVSELHTTSDMEEIGKWLKSANKYFLQKFKDSETCIEQGLTEVSESLANEFIKILKDYIPNAKLRGY